MENASKALIIAAGVLIAILLIVVSFRILNSTSGLSDSVGELGDEMAEKALEANVEMILNSIDYENDEAFLNFVKSRYINKIISSEQAKEVCLLIMQRSILVKGVAYQKNILHISSTELGNNIAGGTNIYKTLEQVEDGATYVVRLEAREHNGKYAHALFITKQ